MSVTDKRISDILSRIRGYYNDETPPVGSKGYALYNAITYAYVLYAQEPVKYSKVIDGLLDKFTAAEALLSLSQS
ncbi:MAG TPA: hypothetical protein VLE02_01850 [Nitrosarchaeum sp.]|nr:hypothetical protein [Nitrosarchaeum sp.]